MTRGGMESLNLIIWRFSVSHEQSSLLDFHLGRWRGECFA
jgi:hypothetical protein